VRALDGISFAVPAGTVFGLLGPNGAGKSTTVKILTTLSRAGGGKARVAGFDVDRQAALVRRSIGLVSQASGVDPEATGRENIVLQGRLHGMRGPALAARADELLERFGLAGAADRVARTYSGGMARKLDVAIGLVQRPRVLFLDEPTTGLDPEARAEMWAEIDRLAQAGLTILLTTHYLEEADRLAAQVAIVEGGRIVAQGSPDELKSALRGDAVHLSLAAVPDAGAVSVLTAALRARAGATEVSAEGRQVHARVADGAASLPAVFAAVAEAGLVVTAATVARPSLDDVYLRHVGRRFAAGAGADPGTETREVA